MGTNAWTCKLLFLVHSRNTPNCTPSQQDDLPKAKPSNSTAPYWLCLQLRLESTFLEMAHRALCADPTPSPNFSGATFLACHPGLTRLQTFPWSGQALSHLRAFAPVEPTTWKAPHFSHDQHLLIGRVSVEIASPYRSLSQPPSRKSILSYFLPEACTCLF